MTSNNNHAKRVFVLKVFCNLQMENNLLYFSVATVVSLATNGVEVREQQNEQSLNNTKDENKRKQGWLIRQLLR